MADSEDTSNTNYSMVTMTTMDRENIYTEAGPGTARKIHGDIKGYTKSKKLLILVVVLVVIAVLALILAGFIALFLEMASLKSEMSSFQQSPPAESASTFALRMQQINETIEDRFEYITNHQNSEVQKLNSSIDGIFSSIENRLEDISHLQESSLQQLNTSMLSRFEDIANFQNNEVHQMNASILLRLEEQLQILSTTMNGSLLSFQNKLNEFEDSSNFQNRTIQQIKASLGVINSQLVNRSQSTFRGFTSFHPATSCAALPPSSPSGYYWVRASNGFAVLGYCDMIRSCGGVTGGWMRVAELDMTNSSHQCPSGLRQRTDANRRTCAFDSNSAGCSSLTFSSATLGYSKVCGKIIAYQYGATEAFKDRGNIDTHYVDGVSLTHGTPRQHIWSFAAAHDEASSCAGCNCPCTNTNTASRATQPQQFVGNDYFCDTGSRSNAQLTFYTNPLWDGAGCGPLNTCCSFNDPPWFYKQLPQPTTDGIEMRVCRSHIASNEDIAIEIVEIYIQ